jgi:predicted RND superfamily exporter protein
VIGDITLGIASSMFASIALGIGIDYSIHLAAETQEECAHSRSLSEALRRAFASTGPSIILSAGVITLGFAVLLLSSVVPNRLLGVLVCISLSICGLMTLLLVPGLAEIFKLGRGIIGTGIPPATADIAGADEGTLPGVRVHKDVLSSLTEKL